jgi:hypothetical protein
MEFLKQSMAVREIARRVRAAVGSIISCSDSAVDLQVNDHALDAVAFAVHAPVQADFGLTIGLGQNAGMDAGLMHFRIKAGVTRQPVYKQRLRTGPIIVSAL